MGSGKGGGGGRRRIGGGGAGPAQGGKVKAPEQLEKLPAAQLNEYREPGDTPINPGGQLVGPGVAVEKLAKADKDSIIAYSGAHVDGGERFKGLNAEKVNRSLYDPEGFKRTLKMAGESEESIADYVKRAKAYQVELDRSLSKVRNYEGEVYRTISNSDLGGGRRIADSFEAGKPVTFREFLSTSRAPNGAYKAYAKAGNGEIRFKIQSKSGKSIEKVSWATSEREVLFKSGSSFNIVSKTYNQSRGSWDIVMEEI